MSIEDELEKLFDEHLDIEKELRALFERESSPFIRIEVREEPDLDEYPMIAAALDIYAEDSE